MVEQDLRKFFISVTLFDHHLQSCSLRITEMKCDCLAFSSYIGIQKEIGTIFCSKYSIIS